MSGELIFGRLEPSSELKYNVGALLFGANGEIYEYVSFESNVAADALVVINSAGVAQSATSTNGVGKLGVCPYAVTASPTAPQYGFVQRCGVVTVNAASATAGAPVATSATAGSVGNTGTGHRVIRGAVFASGVTGGKATVVLGSLASADIAS